MALAPIVNSEPAAGVQEAANSHNAEPFELTNSNADSSSALHETQDTELNNTGSSSALRETPPETSLRAATKDDSLDVETGTEEKAAQPILEDQTNRLPPKQLIVVFMGCSLSIMLAFLDQTIVSTALPRIAADLDAAEELSWVGTSYLLTSTAFQTLWGRFSDIWGRKICLLTAIVIFTVGNALCGLARSIVQLIVFRAIAGVGGGGILTLALVVISDVVSLRERGKYQGLIGVNIAISSVIGPFLGGLLSDSAALGWRWTFYIAVPIAFVAFFMILFLLPLKKVSGSLKHKLKQIDYLGVVLILSTTLLLLLPTDWGGTTYPWSSPLIVTLFCLAAVFFVATILVEIRVDKKTRLPIIPMRLFGNRTVTIVFVTQFLSGVTYYSQLYYIPQFYQVARGESGAQSGLQLFPMLLAQSFASWISGLVVSWTGRYKPSIVVGFAMWAVGDGLLYTLSRDTSGVVLILIEILTGIGAGQTFQTSLVGAQASVSREDLAVVTGLRNFARVIGGTFGLAICGAILNNRLVQLLSSLGLSSAAVDQILKSGTNIPSVVAPEMLNTVLEAYASAIRNVFLFLVPCTALSTILVVVGMEQHSLSRL